jgi:hypothetical protein
MTGARNFLCFSGGRSILGSPVYVGTRISSVAARRLQAIARKASPGKMHLLPAPKECRDMHYGAVLSVRSDISRGVTLLGRATSSSAGADAGRSTRRADRIRPTRREASSPASTRGLLRRSVARHASSRRLQDPSGCDGFPARATPANFDAFVRRPSAHQPTDLAGLDALCQIERLPGGLVEGHPASAALDRLRAVHGVPDWSMTARRIPTADLFREATLTRSPDAFRAGPASSSSPALLCSHDFAPRVHCAASAGAPAPSIAASSSSSWA